MERAIWVSHYVLPQFERGKDLEVRTRTMLTSQIREGDILVISKTVRRKVVQIRRYPSFGSMLEFEDPNRIFPGMNKAEVLAGLRTVYRTSHEAEGVVVLQLEPA